MSDHCTTCMPEFKDLVGVTDAEAWADGRAAVVLCEGCGATQVDPDGNCLGGCLGDYFTKEPHRCPHCKEGVTCHFHSVRSEESQV